MPAALSSLIIDIGLAIGASTTFGSFLIVNASLVAGGIIVGGVLAYGMNAAKKARQAARAAYNAAQVDRLANVDNSVAPRELVLGRVRKGGSVIFRGSAGEKKEIFAMAMVLAAHEIDAIEAVYLNDRVVTLDGNGWVQDAPYKLTRRRTVSAVADSGGIATLEAQPLEGSISAVQFTGAGEGGSEVAAWALTAATEVTTLPGAVVTYDVDASVSKCRVWWVLGAVGQAADARLIELFPDEWTAAHKASGCAVLFMECVYDETAFPSGLPRVSVLMRGAKVFDPRSGLTQWTENPALLMRHVYTHPQFGRATCTADEDARFIAAANACDTPTVYTVDGQAQPSRALYTAAIVQPFGAAPREVLDDLAQAMGGAWAHARGEFFLRPGVWVAPSYTIEDEDLAVVQRAPGGDTSRAITISAHRERAQMVNTINLRIWDEAQAYKESALAPLAPVALVSRDGHTLAQEVRMSAVTHAAQALHCAGIILRDARDALTITAVLKLRAMQVELFDTVTVNLPKLGIQNKDFIVLSSERTGDATVTLALKETSPSVFDLDSDFIPGGAAGNSVLPSPWDIAPPGPLAVAESLALAGDGAIITRLRVSWPALASAAAIGGVIELQWRRDAIDETWQSVTVAASETSADLTGVQDGVVIRLRGRVRTSVAVSDWSAPCVHSVVGKSAPPQDVAWLRVAADVLTWSAVEELDIAGYRLRASPGDSTGDWSSAVALHEGLITETRFLLPLPVPGLVTYMVKAVDTSGNESAGVASVTTVGELALAGNTLTSWPQAPDFGGEIIDGTVTAGVLRADAVGDTFWGGDGSPHFGGDASAYWPASTYSRVEYLCSIFTPAAGILVTQSQIDGTHSIQWRRDQSGSLAWGDDAVSFWGPDAEPFWPTVALPWEPWPGASLVASGTPVDFRITIEPGSVQGSVHIFTPYLDVPTVEELIDDAAIDAGGTRLALSGTFLFIRNVQLTAQSDGGSGVAARVLDKDITGPLVQVIDGAGAAVAGTVDARVIGY